MTRQDLPATLPPTAITQTQVSITYMLAGYHYDALLDYAVTSSRTLPRFASATLPI